MYKFTILKPFYNPKLAEGVNNFSKGCKIDCCQNYTIIYIHPKIDAWLHSTIVEWILDNKDKLYCSLKAGEFLNKVK